MGFRLVKLERDKAETAEWSVPAESRIEEPMQKEAEARMLTQAKQVPTSKPVRFVNGNGDSFTRLSAGGISPQGRTRWGVPIPEGWDPADQVFSRHPLECDCFRAGVLRCGVPCVWAWPTGAKIGDKAPPLNVTTQNEGAE